ncbi:MAG: sigma-54 dependent transcriptional regulator [Arcobacter sp.]|nr:sigma-54 dependent transcriptional regulator [Arcobacter sp.]
MEDFVRSAHPSCFALAALDDDGVPLPPRQIAGLRDRGVRLIVYANGAAAWPIARRCEYLVAGAVDLLDACSARFLADLEEHLAQLFRRERERADADTRAKAEMARLGVVGESRAMLDIFQTVLRVSRLSELPVLLTGETGTGKEVIARAIHSLDPRRCTGPMVAVNCGAIPAALAESELFGHRKGAFTGAEQARRGLFRAADEGTLFLDEVNELDAAMQTKLLRVIQDSRVTAVGEEESVRVDLRLIAASNRDLAELVRTGAFREDLFHRLNVIVIRIPPLRQRPEDIVPLVRHFQKKHGKDTGSAPREASPEFAEALSRHGLPGNVRQLENLIRWILAHHEDSGPLRLKHLPPEIWTGLSTGPEAAAHASGSSRGASYFEELLFRFGGNLARSLDYCERQLLEAALRRSGGNQARAARLTGLTARSIYNKIRKHRLAG